MIMIKNALTALAFLSVALAGAVFAYTTEVTASVISVSYCLACGG
jgi:hypothetical protein